MKKLNKYNTIMKLQDNNCYRIGRVRISITNEDNAVNSILGFVEEKKGGYICISNMRTFSITNKDDKYQEVMENSLMNTPDGTPLVWCGHWWGLKNVGRACCDQRCTTLYNCRWQPCQSHKIQIYQRQGGNTTL